MLDGKPIKPHERQFLMSMVMQGQAKGGPPRKPRAPPISEGQAQRDARTLSREGRPPSIDSRPSRPLRFDGLNGDAPPGIGTQPPAERGVRGVALPQGKSSRSAATGSARLYA